MANNFKPWVDLPTAGQQVQSASVFATDAQRVNGFKAGDPASALRVNSALRQANIVVAGLMQMCDDIKTLPDGLSLMSTVTQVKNAIKAAIDQLDATVLASAKSYTDTRETVIDGKITNVQSQVTSNKNELDVLEPRVDTLEDEVATLYKVPSGGIPKTDLSAAVQQALWTNNSIVLTSDTGTLTSEQLETLTASYGNFIQYGANVYNYNYTDGNKRVYSVQRSINDIDSTTDVIGYFGNVQVNMTSGVYQVYTFTVNGVVTNPTLSGNEAELTGLEVAGTKYKVPSGGAQILTATVKTSTEWDSQNPVLAAGEFGYDTTNKVTKIGDGSTHWNNLDIFVTTKPKPTFANSGWATIAELSENGNAQEYFAVGDEKTIELTTGEQVTLVILGFNHDNLTYGSGKAGITIGMKNLLATEYPMNSSDTNVGGWQQSEMRTETMQTLLSQLPSDLQAVIKVVDKKATAGSRSTTIKTSADKLWLFALAELGSASALENCSCDDIKNNAATYKQEGTQYAYFANTVGDADIYKACPALVKKLSNGSGSANYWWLRSPCVGYSTYFWCVASSGDVADGTVNSARRGYGVSFGFCV